MRNETLNLAISGKRKAFHTVACCCADHAEGRLDDPKLGIDFAKAAPQLGAAAILGATLSPFAAILPFVSGGTAKNADCGALLSEAATHGAPVPAAATSHAQGQALNRRIQARFIGF
ncbi:MAG: hypothetical protein WDM85_17240 [Caulobacteraceae bacterium]